MIRSLELPRSLRPRFSLGPLNSLADLRQGLTNLVKILNDLGADLDLALQRNKDWADNVQSRALSSLEPTELISAQYHARPGQLVRLDTSAASGLVSLPAADESNAGQIIGITRSVGSNSFKVISLGSTFNGRTSISVTFTYRAFVISDGHGIWWQVN